MALNPTGSRMSEVDYTWNPVHGCLYDCKWRVNGKEITCWAADMANRITRMGDTGYSEGFKNHYWDGLKLREAVQKITPSRIAVGTMGDLFGSWVPAKQLGRVLSEIERAHWHTFVVSTKNPARMWRWRDKLPPNLWAGVSVPPQIWDGMAIDIEFRRRLMLVGMGILERLPVPVRWVAIEPFWFDCAEMIRMRRLSWGVLGAATINSRHTAQPDPKWVKRAVRVLDEQGAAVYMRNTLDWKGERRREFPKTT